MIIVTGGAGFIGSNFILDLLENTDISVVNLDKLTYAGNIDNLATVENNENYTLVHGDIGDRQLVFHLLQQYQPEAVINFAAESHVDRSIDSPYPFIETNILGTYNLLESILGYWRTLDDRNKHKFRFLHVSTDEVYGSLDALEPAFKEIDPYEPNSPYAASKASSDHLVRAFHHTYGLPTLTTNCSNNYGPYQFPEKLIPLMILNAISGKPLPVYGDGKNVRDWLYVEDHCKAIRRVLEAGTPGETYNIGGNCEKTNIEVVEAICAMLDELVPDSIYRPHAELITFVKDRPGHDLRYAINAEKIKHELGWSPEETFESGFRKTVQWYLDHQDWCRSVQNKGYAGQRLGLGENKILGA